LIWRISNDGQPGAQFGVPFGAYRLAIDSTGRIVTGGQDFQTNELVVMAFDSSGVEQWSDFVSDPDGAAGAGAVAIGPNDSVVALGSLPLPGPPWSEPWVRHYDADGTEQLTNVAADGTLDWRDVAVGAAGDSYVIGRNANGSYLRHYDPPWNEGWTVTSDGNIPSDDDWATVVIAPGGDLVISGLLSDPRAISNKSWFVRRVGADGATRWTHVDAMSEEQTLIALSPVGRIFAAGGAGDDWIFRAYAP
jgi:hypothetical protein